MLLRNLLLWVTVTIGKPWHLMEHVELDPGDFFRHSTYLMPVIRNNKPKRSLSYRTCLHNETAAH